MKFNPRKLFWTVIVVVLFVAFWATLAPRQVGGKASYVIIRGSSMQPTYAQGDLVILRKSETYRPGDAAAYQHPDLGLVIHRILTQDGERFILKGDNNSWQDDYTPTPSELIGKEWLYFRGAGGVVAFLQGPWGYLILIGVLLVLMFDWLPKKAKNKAKNKMQNKSQERPTTIRWGGTLLQIIEIVALVVGLGLGLLSFTRPPSVDVVNKQAFQHSGVFTYSAPAPEGIYDQPFIQTGEPVFTSLTCTLQIGFDYAVKSALPIKGVHGRYTLRAVVRDDYGWSRSLLSREGAFETSTFQVSAPLDVCAVRSLLANVVEQTGVKRTRYALVLETEVHTQGSLAGQAFEDTYRPTLHFTLTNRELYLEKGMAGAATQDGYVSATSQSANNLDVLGLSLPVEVLRIAAVVATVLGLLLLALRMFIFPLLDKSGAAPITAIDALPVQRLPRVSRSRVVEISSPDDLLKAALQLDLPVFEYRDEAGSVFFIQTGEALLRHTVSAPAQTPSEA